MGRIAPPIFTSVGRGGTNTPGDVFVIQSLLNDRLPKPHAPLAMTGVVDIGTTLAIETADHAGITLVAVAREDGYEVFTHPDRIVFAEGRIVAA